MARIDVSNTEFADIAVCYLLDKLQNPDGISQNNEDFNDLSELLKNKGLRGILLHYYLSMPSKTRIKYRLIKEVFDSKGMKNSSSIIGIKKEDYIEKEPEQSSFLKKVVAIGLAKIGIGKVIK